MKLGLPAPNVAIQTPQKEIDPTWYGKLKQIEAFLAGNAIGDGALATTATTGFAFLPTCAGPPTGVPLAKPGFAPAVVDTTNHKLWIYVGGSWKGVVLT